MNTEWVLNNLESRLEELPFEVSSRSPYQHGVYRELDSGLFFCGWGSGEAGCLILIFNPADPWENPKQILLNTPAGQEAALLKCFRAHLENELAAPKPPVNARSLIMEAEQILAATRQNRVMQTSQKELGDPLDGRLVITLSQDPTLGRVLMHFSKKRSSKSGLEDGCFRLRALSLLADFEQKPPPPSGPFCNLPQSVFERFLRTEAMHWVEAGTRFFSSDIKEEVGIGSLQIGLSAFSRDEWLKVEFKLKDRELKSSLMRRFDEKRGLVQSRDDGSWHLLSLPDLHRMRVLQGLTREFKDGVAHLLGSPMLQALVAEKLQLAEAEKHHFPILNEAVLQPIKAEALVPDTGFQGKLRKYQQIGAGFILNRLQVFSGAALCDEMGLGKTVQTLAVLHTLHTQKQIQSILILCPKATVEQWRSEILRFSPQLSPKTTLLSWQAMRNRVQSGHFPTFCIVVADEFQYAKNYRSQTRQALAKVQAGLRIALSATPMENHLGELYSLMDFLYPGALGSLRWYQKHLAQAIEKEGLIQRKEILNQLVSRFVLRRTSMDLDTLLPQVVEETIRLAPCEEEASAYAAVSTWFQRVEDQKELSLVLTAILRLRQITVDPVMADKELKGVESAKHTRLLRDLHDLKEQKQKVLIFSSFSSYLQRLARICGGEAFTGNTSDSRRQKILNWFQKGRGARLLFLSLKAGGVSLNLPDADQIILIEPWWNPHAEAQAIGRANRLGRTAPLPVRRYVTMATVEERMNDLRKKKMKLLRKFGSEEYHDAAIPEEILDQIL